MCRKAGRSMTFRLLSAFSGGLILTASKRVRTVCAVAFLAALCTGAESAFADDAAGLPLQPQSLNYAGIYELRQVDPNLTGEGLNIALVCRSITYLENRPQNDYRPSVHHNCLQHVTFSFHDQAQTPQPASAHSTAIASILFGEDPNAFHSELGRFYYQGVTPRAGAVVSEFWNFIAENVFSNAAPEAEVLTMSIGSQFEDWWTRGIDAMAERHGLIVVAGIGNGSALYDPLLYPAAGANVIGVGVINSVDSNDLAVKLANFSLPSPEHSSRGPTEDGRCKPDIVAPGNCLAAGIDSPSEYEPMGDWSSFSTPIVAGTAALLVEKAKQDPILSPAVSSLAGNCIIKAILLNSAKKLPFWHKGTLTKEDDHEVPLDYVQGAGALDATGAYKQLIAGPAAPGDVPRQGWDGNRLAAKGENVYTIKVPADAEQVITATLVWNKHFAQVYPFEALPEMDADLRLELWAVDSEDRQKSFLLDYSNSPVDNVEHIHSRTDPNYADYEIVVSFSNGDDPNNIDKVQQYALAWNVAQVSEEDSALSYELNADGVVNELDVTILLKYLSDIITAEAGPSPRNEGN